MWPIRLPWRLRRGSFQARHVHLPRSSTLPREWHPRHLRRRLPTMQCISIVYRPLQAMQCVSEVYRRSRRQEPIERVVEGLLEWIMAPKWHAGRKRSVVDQTVLGAARALLGGSLIVPGRKRVARPVVSYI